MTREEYISFQRNLPVSNEQDDCVMVDITYECNSGCPYCYAGEGTHRPLLEILREIESAPQRRVLVSGGEPTRHPDLYDVLEATRMLGKLPILLTNGELLTLSDMKRLLYHGLSVAYGFPQIAVSLQLPGTSRTHVTALNNLHRIFVDTLSFTVSKLDQIPEIVALCTSLKGRYRAVCIRTAWDKNRDILDIYDVIVKLDGDLLSIPAPYAERSASVQKDGVHYKIISWPSVNSFDPAVFSGKGVWYRGKNVVETLCNGDC